MHYKNIYIKERVLGEHHYETVNSYLSLAITLYKNKSYTKAQNMFEDKIMILKKILGESHQLVISQENSWRNIFGIK